MPSRDPKVSAIAAAKAREAWEVPPSQVSVRGRLRIPSDLAAIWEEQDTEDRGMAWAIGCLLINHSMSYIVSSNDVTVILGQHSATGETIYDAILSLLKGYYGYELPQPNDLEERLMELDLLE